MWGVCSTELYSRKLRGGIIAAYHKSRRGDELIWDKNFILRITLPPLNKTLLFVLPGFFCMHRNAIYFLLRQDFISCPCVVQ